MGCNPYTGRMSFFKDASVKGGMADLFGYMREQRGGRLLILLLAYFESWPADRSVEESLAAIREYQKKKDAMRAREREAYKALGSAVGMDVETLDAEAQKDEAERRAKAEANIAARVGASK